MCFFSELSPVILNHCIYIKMLSHHFKSQFLYLFIYDISKEIQQMSLPDLQKGIQKLVDLTKSQQQSISPQLIKMPQLALVMSKYFLSLSKVCLTHYHSYSHSQKKQKQEKQQKQKQKEQILIQNLPPKKPLTAYILYFQERVPDFQLKYPKSTISQLTRLIAKQWKELTESQKSTYLGRASDDRKRYQQQKKKYKLKKDLKMIDQQQLARRQQQNESEQLSQDMIKVKQVMQEGMIQKS